MHNFKGRKKNKSYSRIWHSHSLFFMVKTLGTSAGTFRQFNSSWMWEGTGIPKGTFYCSFAFILKTDAFLMSTPLSDFRTFFSSLKGWLLKYCQRTWAEPRLPELLIHQSENEVPGRRLVSRRPVSRMASCNGLRMEEGKFITYYF